MPRMSLLGVLVGQCLGVAALPAHAQAQELTGKIAEDFNAFYAQSSVGAVRAVFQGRLPASANLSRLRVLVPGSDKSMPICVSAATFDSSYTARGELRARPGVSRSLSLQVGTFSIHAEKVSRYAGRELAVGLIVSSDCDLLPDPLVLPAAADGPIDELHVAVIAPRNSEEPKARLTPVNGKGIAAKCTSVSDAARRASYSYMCSFPIDPSAFRSGLAAFHLYRKTGDSSGSWGKPVRVYVASR